MATINEVQWTLKHYSDTFSYQTGFQNPADKFGTFDLGTNSCGTFFGMDNTMSGVAAPVEYMGWFLRIAMGLTILSMESNSPKDKNLTRIEIEELMESQKERSEGNTRKFDDVEDLFNWLNSD